MKVLTHIQSKNTQKINMYIQWNKKNLKRIYNTVILVCKKVINLFDINVLCFDKKVQHKKTQATKISMLTFQRLKMESVKTCQIQFVNAKACKQFFLRLRGYFLDNFAYNKLSLPTLVLKAFKTIQIFNILGACNLSIIQSFRELFGRLMYPYKRYF